MRMNLDALLAEYLDGDEVGWDAEFKRLWAAEFTVMVELCESVRRHGVLKPILLGPDGRVWDGHHRLAAAQAVGLAEVPVTTPAEEPAEDLWARYVA